MNINWLNRPLWLKMFLLHRREIEYGVDGLGRHATFADTKGTRFRTAGRGETDTEAIKDLYKNELNR